MKTFENLEQAIHESFTTTYEIVSENFPSIYSQTDVRKLLYELQKSVVEKLSLHRDSVTSNKPDIDFDELYQSLENSIDRLSGNQDVFDHGCHTFSINYNNNVELDDFCFDTQYVVENIATRLISDLKLEEDANGDN